MDLDSSSLDFLIPIMSQKDVTFIPKLGEELECRGHDIAFIPQNERLTLRDSRKTIQSESLVQDHIQSEPESPFGELLDRYEISSPRSLVFPQMVYDYNYPNVNHQPFLLGKKTIDYGPYLKLLHRSLDTFDKIYGSSQGPIPIQHQGAEVLRRALQCVADIHDVKSVWVGNSPVRGHCGLYGDEQVNWDIFERTTIPNMTEQERVRARDYVNSIRADQPLTGINETETGFDPFGNINRIPGRIRRLFSPNHSSTAMIGGWARSRGRAAGKRTKALLERRLALDKQSSTKFISNNKYVFFPVQYVRESRVTVRSPLYYDLPWLIEFLSRSLPPKYELVIKDHPSQTGALPIDTIRALNRYSQFIHPELNAHKVIKDAAAVITLNNTVGYEALLHGKPVLVLGSAFYDGSNCARSIQKIEKLPSELADAVESGRLSEEKILSFAHCIIEGSYSGTWDDSDQENIDELVDSILAYCDFE